LSSRRAKAHDATAYGQLMEVDDARPKVLIGDKGYDMIHDLCVFWML
jgi:hypothetical protein